MFLVIFNMKFIALSFVFSVTILFPSACLACKTLQELDQCAYEANLLSNRELVIPTTDEEVISFCDKAKAGLKCISDHASECTKGAIKSISLKVINDLEGHLNGRCLNPQDRAEFIRNIQCLTDNAKAEAIRMCSDKHMVMMEKVAKLPKQLHRSVSCCSAYSFHECAINKIAELCGSESADYFEGLIADVAEENAELVCQDFTDMDKCNSKLDPDIWNDLKAIMDSEDPAIMGQHTYKTIVPIIIEMLRSA